MEPLPTDWLSRLRDKLRTFECYAPADLHNPVPGQWTVVGPTSEYRSAGSPDEAAMRYLATVCGDTEAEGALAAKAIREYAQRVGSLSSAPKERSGSR